MSVIWRTRRSEQNGVGALRLETVRYTAEIRLYTVQCCVVELQRCANRRQGVTLSPPVKLSELFTRFTERLDRGTHHSFHPEDVRDMQGCGWSLPLLETARCLGGVPPSMFRQTMAGETSTCDTNLDGAVLSIKRTTIITGKLLAARGASLLRGEHSLAWAAPRLQTRAASVSPT